MASTRAINMQQSDIRCLNLWNGTSNNAAPSGWTSPSFNDSGWPHSAVPTTIDNGAFSHVWSSFGSGGATPPAPQFAQTLPFPTGVEPIWPTTSVQNPRQFAVFRWWVELPEITVGPPLTIGPPNTLSPITIFSPGGGGAFHKVWINGTSMGTMLQGIWGSEQVLNAALQPVVVAGQNLFAFSAHDGTTDPNVGGPGSIDFWGNQAYMALQINVYVSATRGMAQVIG